MRNLGRKTNTEKSCVEKKEEASRGRTQIRKERAQEVFSLRQVKGELTILIQGQANSKVEPPSDIELESELRELIASGESLSTAVKLVTGKTSVSRKTIYSLALRKFGKQLEVEDDSN
ncbi:hypothetical protein ACSQ67_018400 [Phaseolus vulgaris]